ncbi:MAG TPA: glycosyltransferase [Lentimicrobium sp.]|nr:glycosyltransferase [Lentimicrobium sp.]
MKILAVASAGGHWIQLLRLRKAFEGAEIIYVSTHKASHMSENKDKYYSIIDANRWNKLKLIQMAYQVKTIIDKEKPDYIISTGAAPGLAAILWGRLRGSKTIWIDSIANVERISLSGRLIKPFSDLHITQWPHLAKGKTIYKGTVIA